MSKDDEYKVSDVLGRRNIVHFIDLNPEMHKFKLSYIEMIKRCEECERRVIYLTEICQQYRITLTPCDSISQLDNIVGMIAE